MIRIVAGIVYHILGPLCLLLGLAVAGLGVRSLVRTETAWQWRTGALGDSLEEWTYFLCTNHRIGLAAYGTTFDENSPPRHDYAWLRQAGWQTTDPQQLWKAEGDAGCWRGLGFSFGRRSHSSTSAQEWRWWFGLPYWFACPAFLLAGAPWVLQRTRQVRRHYRLAHGLCPSCGQEPDGRSGRCAHCGAIFASPAAGTPLPDRPVEQFDRDLPCIRCGYNLRTLVSSGICPECGLAIARTLVDSGRLEHADPRWLGRLKWGTILLLVMWAAPWVTFPAAVVLATRGDDEERYVLWTMAGFVPLALWAVHLLSSRPRRYGTRGLSKLSLPSYVCVVLFATPVVVVLLGIYGTATFRSRDLTICAWLGVSGVALWILLLFWRLRQLTRELSTPSLPEHAAILAIAAPCLPAISGLLWLAQRLGHTDRLPEFFDEKAGLLFMGTYVACVLLHYLWSLVILIRCALWFRRYQWEAHEQWLAATGVATIEDGG